MVRVADKVMVVSVAQLKSNVPPAVTASVSPVREHEGAACTERMLMKTASSRAITAKLPAMLFRFPIVIPKTITDSFP